MKKHFWRSELTISKAFTIRLLFIRLLSFLDLTSFSIKSRWLKERRLCNIARTFNISFVVVNEVGDYFGYQNLADDVNTITSGWLVQPASGKAWGGCVENIFFSKEQHHDTILRRCKILYSDNLPQSECIFTIDGERVKWSVFITNIVMKICGLNNLGHYCTVRQIWHYGISVLLNYNLCDLVGIFSVLWYCNLCNLVRILIHFKFVITTCTSINMVLVHFDASFI